MVDIKEFWKRETGYTIRDVDTSSDGEYILVGSFDHKVYLFNRDGTLLWSYLTGDTVRDVAISFDGKYMAAGSYDKYVYFFNTDGTLLWKYPAMEAVRDVSISAGGEFVVVGSNDNHVYFFNRKGDLLWKYQTGGYVLTVALSMRGEYIAIGSNDKKIYFFNKFGDMLWYHETGSALRDVEMTTKGKYIAAGSYDNHLYYLDRAGRLLWKRKRESPVVKVALSPSGEHIATGGIGEVALYNRSGDLNWSHTTGQYEVRGLEISTKGGSIICGSRDNELTYYDKSGTLLWKYRTPQWVEAVAVGSRGRFIVAGSRSGILYLFDGLDFFQKYIEEARQAIVKFENLGIGAGKARTMYDEAIMELQRENYMKALTLAIRIRTLSERAVMKNRPILSYKVESEGPLSENTWIPVHFKLSNSGNADAGDIFIRFNGPFRVRGERRLDKLQADSVVIRKLDIRPMSIGTQKMEMLITYSDNSGRQYSETDITRIQVRESPTFDASFSKSESTRRSILFNKKHEKQDDQSTVLRTEPHCPNCNRNIWSNWIVCPYCATPLK